MHDGAAPVQTANCRAMASGLRRGYLTDVALARNRAAVARRMAAAALERGDPNGWFEELYATADRGEAWVPWAELVPNPHLVSWASQRQPGDAGRRALVVGCGFGDDAEFLAGLGFAVTAFDVAPTAVAGSKSRFPGSAVEYVVADILDPPGEWRASYDLVIEVYTVQVHRGQPRTAAIRHIASMVAPGGTLLVIARAREADEELGPMPWPLTLAEVTSFATDDLRLAEVGEVYDCDPPGRRWRAEFHRGTATGSQRRHRRTGRRRSAGRWRHDAAPRMRPLRR